MKIALMTINASTTDSQVAIVTDQGSTGTDTNYYVKTKAVGEGPTQLQGIILKIGELSVGLSYGLSLISTGLSPGIGIMNFKYLPYLPNLGLTKLGPAIINVIDCEEECDGPPYLVYDVRGANTIFIDLLWSREELEEAFHSYAPEIVTYYCNAASLPELIACLPSFPMTISLEEFENNIGPLIESCEERFW
jgi:hypothetical protein